MKRHPNKKKRINISKKALMPSPDALIILQVNNTSNTIACFKCIVAEKVYFLNKQSKKFYKLRFLLGDFCSISFHRKVFSLINLHIHEYFNENGVGIDSKNQFLYSGKGGKILLNGF